ncbi:MAG: NAD(P)-dependent oxidoreductase [Deltaproteobacteria bacterium]|nr:NAD(P)-dependent oxidoreductase [Deltaproteobacteria bacterium]
MKAFVTGWAGYIGVHLVDLLKQAGHTVTGCDLGLFRGCEFESFVRPDVELQKDIRAISRSDLQGHDCVMHLAALSNDPMGEIDPSLTYSVNREGSIRLARVAKESGVPRFLFAGSCSVYGKGKDMDLDENAGFNPLSAYARSKIDTETEVRKLAGDGFSPVFLRNSTAYGFSPMLRLDLVVNDLLACAVARGDIRIKSDGKPWRPLIHCRDIARAFVAMAEAPPDSVHNVAVNVGANDENYQVKDVAARVQRLIPGAQVVFTGEIGSDPRDYRVKFDLLNKVLPGFRLSYNLDTGMEELLAKLREHKFGTKDYEGDAYVRLRTLKKRLGELSG